MNLTGKKLLILGATAGEISLVKRAKNMGFMLLSQIIIRIIH